MPTIRMHLRSLCCAAAAAASVMSTLAAHGQQPEVMDSSPAERDVQVLETLLTGVFANGSQAIFEPRLDVPETDRAPRRELMIAPIDAPDLGDRVLALRAYEDRGVEVPAWAQLWALQADGDGDAVRVQIFDAQLTTALALGAPPAQRGDVTSVDADCELIFTREAGQVRGAPVGEACAGPVREVMASPDALWMTGAETRAELRRARVFQCYLDVPGISGGREMEFTRYRAAYVHDQGGMAMFGTGEQEGRDLGVVLQNVHWPINNEVGAFTRDSLVVYLFDADDGQVAYGFTQPDAERLGFNLFEMLVYCYMTSNYEAEPRF